MKQQRNAVLTLIASAAPLLAQTKTVRSVDLPRLDLATPGVPPAQLHRLGA